MRVQGSKRRGGSPDGLWISERLKWKITDKGQKKKGKFPKRRAIDASLPRE
ncbi:hypothetical protein [Peribacillus simplex]|uniref:hypothetical protein n=1 Tax=Peribacillus simplex TaxID=1478 RepID=UPI000AC3978E|nr:hypothetical protein [Peribacillus simplex]